MDELARFEPLSDKDMKNTQSSTVIMLVERRSMKTWQLLSWSHSYTECCTLKTVNRWWSNFLVSGRMCVCVLS